jgi:glycosyltransferase involved in cell wall biosynthesis
MRVLMLYNERRVRGGEDVMVDSITRLLQQNGDFVYLWTRNNANFENSLLRKTGVFFSGIYSRSAKLAITRLIEQIQPDVIHAHNLYPLFSPSVLVAARRARVPVVLHLHSYLLTCPITFHFKDGNICERCLTNNELWCILKNCRNNICESIGYSLRNMVARKLQLFKKNVTTFISLTHFAKSLLIQAGYPEEKITILNNFSKITNYKGKTNIGNYVAFTGRLSCEKGITTLLEAAARLPEIPFKVAGDGPLMQESIRSAPNNVSFLGWLNRDKLADFYQQARFVVMPSIWYEGHPVASLEAMGYGLPVIASRIGGLGEFVEEGVTGLLADPGNSRELAAKIAYLWHDQGLILKMGGEARENVIRSSSAEIYYSRLMDIYKTAMQLNSDIMS